MNVHKNKYTAQRAPLQVTFKPAVFAVLTAMHDLATRPRPTPRAPAPAVAINCSADTSLTTPVIAPRGKACRACGVHKPLAEFAKHDGRRERRRVTCMDCVKEAELNRIAKAQKKAVASGVSVHKLPAPKACDALGNDEEDQDLFYLGTKGGPVTLDVLQAYARSMPGTRIVFTCGNTRVDAVYAEASNDFSYAFGSWPVDADYVTRVFDHLNSGRTAGGFW